MWNAAENRKWFVMRIVFLILSKSQLKYVSNKNECFAMYTRMTQGLNIPNFVDSISIFSCFLFFKSKWPTILFLNHSNYTDIISFCHTKNDVHFVWMNVSLWYWMILSKYEIVTTPTNNNNRWLFYNGSTVGRYSIKYIHIHTYVYMYIMFNHYFML